ncbi:ABC-type transport auxiliary lipoprotein family protein [Phenylobacterium sp.]|uniref:ABC-type transport auxiliary lipoprotein family protein n=1 Tax=Phenylobacterium sp. TaxID=1871053 RepID=UPI0027208682|nr:ABC-type transport auxiliary lipoprotein family protein [Phenylobacterium sp.]MDO8380126.1 ABC-type transport auxiliary lipoprotein family protein [Phenylobacterium sp.]
MTRLQRLFRLTVAAATAVALTGCITLLPKTKPAQLYSFGYVAPADAAAPPAGETFGVLKLANGFTRAAAGDQILTITGGNDAAYIGQARWVSAATVLFDEAVNRAFDRGGPARLIGRGEMGKSDYALKLIVADFKVAYDTPKASPQVVVSVHATLTRSTDRTLVAERTFEQKVPVTGNRQAAIVAGFNTAVSGVLSDIVAWTGALGQTPA